MEMNKLTNLQSISNAIRELKRYRGIYGKCEEKVQEKLLMLL